MSAVDVRATVARLRHHVAARRWDIVVLIGLLAAVVVVQLQYLKPPWIYDPADYYHSAQDWPDVFVHHRPLRVGLVVPVRIAQELFGISEASWYAVPMASLLLLAIATYLVGRQLFGVTVGASAGLLVAVNPYVLTWSSQIFPDVPSAALFTMAVAVVLRVARRRPSGAALTWQDHAWLVAAGLLLGWAYLVREFVVVLFPVVVLILLAYRTRRSSIVTVASAAAAVFGMELVANHLLYDDALLRVREIVEKPDLSTARAEERVAARREARGSVVDRLLLLPRLLLRLRGGWAFLGLGAVGVAGVALDRRRRGMPLLVWAATIWAVLIGLSFIEVSGGQAVLHPALMRYWYPFFPPLVVAGLAGIMVVAERVLRRPAMATALVVAAAAGTVVLGIQAVAQQPGTLARGADHFRELRDHLAHTEADAGSLWTDGRTGRVLPMYTASVLGETVWDGSVRWLNNARSFGPRGRIQEDDLILLDEEFFRARMSNIRGAVPDWLLGVPDTWDMQFMPDNSEFVLLSAEKGDDRQLASFELDDAWHWSALPRRGETVTEPTGLVDGTLELGGRDRVTVVDGAHPSVTSGGDAPRVTAGATVRFDVSLAAEGRGNVVPVCHVFGDGRRHDVKAVTLWGVPNDRQTVSLWCRAPVDGAVRLAFQVSGPIEAAFGSVDVAVDPEPDL